MIVSLSGGFRGGRGGNRGYRGHGIGRGHGNDRVSSNYGRILSATVEGKTVKSKSYSKAEFSSMTGPQRIKFIELNNQRRQSNLTNNNDAHSASHLSVSISAAIIAGLKEATKTNVTFDDDITEDGDGSTSTKRRAESGGAGDFIANRCKKTSKKE